MSLVLPLLATFSSVTVSATVPPRCGFEVMPGAISAWCNAERWDVVAREPDGTERIVWQGRGVGQVKLPAEPAANYRLDLDY